MKLLMQQQRRQLRAIWLQAYHYYILTIKNATKSFITKSWQQKWASFNSRLNGIKPFIGDWKSAYRENRKEEKILSRLQTGCCRFQIQQYIDPVQGDNYCAVCRTPITISHLLVECTKFNNFRLEIKQYLRNKNLPITEENILGDDFPHEKLFSYLKNIHFYNKI